MKDSRSEVKTGRVDAASGPALNRAILPTGEATGILPVREGKLTPVTVIGTAPIRETFDDLCIRQAINSRCAPGVTDIVLNPDAHAGYGAPVGCVLVSPDHIYPGPVGVDIKCSMSLLQLDLPEAALDDKRARRALIDAILERTPTGAGHRDAPKGRRVDAKLGARVVTEGASAGVLAELGVPVRWAQRCEDAFHVGHDDSADALRERLERCHLSDARGEKAFASKMTQLGTYGGGNHFGECEAVRVEPGERARATAEIFGLRDRHIAFLSHCGSRGWGALLARHHFKTLAEKFERWNIPLPGEDRQLVYAPLGSAEADAYLDDMAMGANFATVNHLLINALVLEAFQEVMPGVKGELVYFISHNIARREVVRGRPAWVHRKGATRAFPAGHHALKGTPFEATGHPILLPGNPQDGSSVMVADPGAERSCFSVNHGAGRRMSRTAATKTLDQKTVDASFDAADILTNCRNYPRDEAPGAYKDFNAVLESVKLAGLASEVARLRARFVIKDGDAADD
ncbi:MAG: RtcB family protein [Planctomycetota bacterium]|nr:RtcB family protein [Planctomycetota bacterium]